MARCYQYKGPSNASSIQEKSILVPKLCLGPILQKESLGSMHSPQILRFKRVFYLFVIFFFVRSLSFAVTALPTGFVESQFVTGLSGPTAMAFAPDGRIFVSEQAGKLRVIKNGQLLTAPFLTVTVNSSGERGLLGVTFDPNFASNNFVYVYYTATTPAIHNRISRFTASGDKAVAGSEVVLLDLNNLSSATNHNGGAMHFGTDGKLYVSVGEMQRLQMPRH